MIDSHCHINDPAYLADPKKYIDEAKASGVTAMLVIGYDLKSSIDAVKIAEQYDDVYAAIGIHPSEVKKMGEHDLKEIENLLHSKKVLAIGEIGLDYYWDKDITVRNEQIYYFEKQIDLANKHNLPIVIHSRDAMGETYNVLKNHHVKCGGILHCYAGSKEMLPDFVKLGFVVGIGGTVTFKNAITIKEVAKKVNPTDYVLETDAPYLAPVPHRGELNHSKYLRLIASEIASIRGDDVSEVIKHADENFKRIMKL